MDNLEIAAFFIVVAGIASAEFIVSAAILEIIAGVIAHNLVGLEPMADLEIFANLGLVCLMYVAGLEIDFDRLRLSLVPSTVIGFFSFAVPFAAVFMISLFGLGLSSEEALISAIALSATSVAIVYPIMKVNGMDDTAKHILSAVMICDLFSMLALSLEFTEFTLPTVGLIGGLFVFSKMFPSFGRRVFSKYKGNPVELEFKVILFIMLGIAIASEKAGIESAMAAFLLGMITSQVVVEHANLQRKFMFIVFGLFSPIFFFTVGLGIDIGMVTGNIGLFFVFLIAASATKFAGTYLPAKRYLPGHAAFMGVLFNSPLTIGIVAATLGYREGIIGDSLFAPLVGAIVTAAIISGIIAPRLRPENGQHNTA